MGSPYVSESDTRGKRGGARTGSGLDTFACLPYEGVTLAIENSRRAVVAAGHEAVVAAAKSVLRAGGNAFDAAVSGGFAAAVAEPGYTSLGGGGFLLARTAAGEEVLFDFFVDTPGTGEGAAAPQKAPHLEELEVRFAASTQTFMVGRGSVAVPGCLAGYLHVHERLGRLPLSAVVAPAVELGRNGVVVNAAQAYVLRVLAPVLTLEAEGAAIFAPEGRILRAGDRMGNDPLAEFLSELPNRGRPALYQGARAAQVAADIQDGGGVLNEHDLANYEVRERPPLVFAYRGRRVLGNPAPALGGGLLALACSLAESFDFRGEGFGSARHVGLLAAVMREVETLRSRGICFPADLGSEGLGAERERVRAATSGTTHVSVVDREGNAASMTTSNGECSGYVVPGTGIMLNNMLGEEDLHPGGHDPMPPGVRISSMMSPIVVLSNRETELVAGSGGSKRIRSALLQVASNVVDFDMPVGKAVEAPRVHWDGEALQVEPGFDAASLDAVERAFEINRWPQRDFYFGGVHAVVPGVAGAGDPRRDGAAAVVQWDGDA
jgi:gamma-glutamyltranspeptidase/glutathione hydrolase